MGLTERTYGGKTAAELRKLDAGRTQGEWAWRFPNGGMPSLVAPSHGMRLILDAVRHGMNKATLRFAKRSEGDRGGIMHHAEQFFPDRTPGRPDYQEPNNPDMQAISAAVNALGPLLDENERLTGDIQILYDRISEAAEQRRSINSENDGGLIAILGA